MEYEDLWNQYESMKSDNDSMNVKLEAEQLRIQEILNELKKVKSNAAYQISKFKDELGTMRDISKSYIRTMDSLNRLNKQLIAENIEVKGNYEKARGANEELSEKNKDLSEKV